MGYSSVPSTADSNLEFTPVEAIGTIHREARSFFWTHATVSREFRMTQLEGISRLVEENRDALVETIRQDLGQNSMYSEAFELSHIQPRAMHARENLSEWMETQRKPTPWPVNVNVPVRSELTPQPRGVCLIITPFNLPVQLSLNPMIDAIAAGNVVVLKMSEKCAHTTRLMTDLLTSGEYVDPRAVRVVNGAADEVTELLRHRFDCISYTGSSKVGKIVAAAAAKHLTPVLLELGGKNPAFVTSRCHIPSAARRIAWGKVSGNAGQMCICPDYVLVDESIKDEFVAELASSLDEMYPVSSYADGNHGGDGCDVGKMISVEHARRVVDMVDSTSRVVYGGEHHDVEGRFVAPTVVEVDADAEDATVMREEIFGPILAVVPVRGVDRMIEYVQRNFSSRAEHPLVIYIFSRDKSEQRRIMRCVPSGSCGINDTMKQSANYNLPFGGVGYSGYGQYYGRYGFDFFSHYRGTLVSDNYSTSRLDPSNWITYPPYDGVKVRCFRLLGRLPSVAGRARGAARIVLPLAFCAACAARPSIVDALLELNAKTVLGWILGVFR